MSTPTDRFLDKLAGVADPEKKRKIIGDGVHPRSSTRKRASLDGIEFLAQGTIYPDILESERGVKAHHNVGRSARRICSSSWSSR